MPWPRPTRPTRGCRSCCESELKDDASLAEALALLRAHPAMDRAQERTNAVAAEATAALDALPDSEAKSALAALATSVVTRVG